MQHEMPLVPSAWRAFLSGFVSGLLWWHPYGKRLARENEARYGHAVKRVRSVLD